MKRSRPRRESAKHLAEHEERQRVIDAVLERDKRQCQATAAPGPCGGRLDVHELIPRSVWRAGYLVVDNCLTVCRRHHDFIDDYPEAAHALGLHKFSWEAT